MPDNIVNEDSTGWLTIEFKDKAGNLEAPDSASYRIDCLTTGQEVRADTPLVAPGGSVELELEPSDTAIITAANRSETKRVTVTSSFGAGGAHNEDYEYVVKNLHKV